MIKNKASYSEFMKEVFPYETTFERKHFGFFTNLIKFFSLRVAYFLYLINVSANGLTIFSTLLTVPCFYLLYEGLINDSLYLLLCGYSLICLILFIDFVDGSLARISKFSYAAGDALDNLPPDIIRIGSILFFGVMTGSNLFMLLAFVSSIVISCYIPATNANIQNKRKWILTVYASRMALTGLRLISLALIPLITLTVFFNEDVGVLVTKSLVLIYFLLSLLWIIFTLEDKAIKN